MDEEAVNTSVDTEVASPASETVEPDYNDLEYDETQEVAPAEEVADENVDEGTESDEGDDTGEATQEKSPRFEKRIRQLSAKVKELSTPAPQVAAAPQIAPPVPPSSGQNPAPRQLPPGDYTPEEINAWVTQEAARLGQALGSIEVQQLRAELNAKDQVAAVQTTYTNDLHAVESKYPELNEDSPEFDEEAAQAVTEMYEDFFQADPKSASLTKIADRIMSVRRKAATKAASSAAKSVASQRSASAQSSTTSGPSKSETKWTPEAVAELSIEEYAANEDAIKRDLYGR